MAAIERGSGSDEDVVRAILAKALSASRGDQWVCSVCGHAHVEWSPTCHNCSAFDTMEWKEPAESEAEPMDAVLSLIVGATPIAAAEPDEPQDDAPIIIDAEVVDEDSV